MSRVQTNVETALKNIEDSISRCRKLIAQSENVETIAEIQQDILWTIGNASTSLKTAIVVASANGTE